jgi:phage RecT family recombinase
MNNIVPIEEVARFLPPGQDPQRWLAVAEKFASDPKLAECTKASLRAVVLDIAATGLAVDGKRAAIVAYKGVAKLQLGYLGYVELVRRNGWHITSGLIRKGDLFEEERGTNQVFRHRPLLGNDGEIIASYAFGRGPDGVVEWEVTTYEHCMKVRECSRGYQDALQYGKDHPWMDGHVGQPEMLRKTPVRLLCKRLKLDADTREVIQKDVENDIPDKEEIRIVRPTTSPLAIAPPPAPVLGPLDRPLPKSLAAKVGWPAGVTVNQALHEHGVDGREMVGLLLKTIEEAPAASREKVKELEDAIKAAGILSPVVEVEEVTK